MKKIKTILTAIILLFAVASLTSSCDEPCNGMGTLKLTNSSLFTVQKIMINGVSYGTIDPGEEKEFELNPGTYAFQFVGISGGSGCSPAVVHIVECETSSYKCNAK